MALETDTGLSRVPVASASLSATPPASEKNNGFTSSTPVPLRTAETFEAYCAQIQARLAEHAQQRGHFLQAASERLTALLHAARAVEDQALYGELWQQRLAVKELLEALSQVPANKPIVSVPTHTLPLPAKPLPLETANGYRPTPDYRENSPSALLFAQAPHPAPVQAVTTAPAPRLPRRPVRPLADIESDAIRLRKNLENWNERQPLQLENGELNVPNCLRLRAVACRQRRLEEEAGDTEVAEVTELGDDIEALLDAAHDEEYTVALDYEIDPIPTAYQWGEMAERYEEMAYAYEAFLWWNKHWNELTVSAIQPLAEAVAAIQQRFNRLLFKIGARDPFQQQLFDDLRLWAREQQCYLHSLRPKVPFMELIERASTLDTAWSGARAALMPQETPFNAEIVVEYREELSVSVESSEGS